MKRALVPMVVVLTLGVSSTAWAAFYAGPVAGGINNAGVEIKVKFREGHPRKVTRFEWHNVPVGSRCYDSEIFFHRMPLNDALKFNGSGHPGKRGSRNYPVNRNVTATISGQLKNHGRKIEGQLELQGTFPGGCVNADSGSLSFVATRQASPP